MFQRWGTAPSSNRPTIELRSEAVLEFFAANEHRASEATDGGFVDIGEHRATHAPAYRQFADVAKDTSYDPDREAHVALLRGLFLTGWLAEDLLFDNDNFGAEATVITSASSKTSIALAWTIAQRGGHAIGLTSANEAFVSRLGCYEVIPYDEIGSITDRRSVIVDTGNGQVLAVIGLRRIAPARWRWRKPLGVV